MNRGRCFAPATAPLAVLRRECHSYNRLHDIIGILRYTTEGWFLQVLEGPKSAVRRLYYHGILSDPCHYHCQVLGEGAWPLCSFAIWKMGFRYAQSHDLRTLLGEAAPNSLSLIPRFYPRTHLLEMILDFVAQDQPPAWQEHP